MCPAERRFREACLAAIQELGADAAGKVWLEALQPSGKKRGRPRKEIVRGWDAAILAIYDELIREPTPKGLIRYMARSFYENKSSHCRWQSPAALERRIRRLLSDRAAGLLVKEERPEGIPFYRRVRGQ